MKARLRAELLRWSARVRRYVDADHRLVAREFDPAFYLTVNRDVAAARLEPLHHFMTHGWREGRDPNARFSVREYLNSYPDVARAGTNPFVDYLRTGRAQGRSPTDDLGFRYDVIARLTPVEAQVAVAAKATSAAPADPTAKLAAGLRRSRTGLSDLHITFSQDDYRTQVGGIQLCLQREEALLAELGRDHLHLHPASAWPVLRDREAGRLSVLLNGEPLGTFDPADVAAALRDAAGPRGGARSFAIHSLLGHAVDETCAIVEAAGARDGFFWLHDYASLCAGFNLLRNGVEDCGAPPPDSAACGICLYGPWRRRHLEAHERLFRRLKLTVVSPAVGTLEFWRRSWDFPAAGMLAHPHATLVPRRRSPPVPADRPLRVAFIGYPVAHKGWPIFRRLAVTHADDPRYAFLHLGARRAPEVPAEFHDTRVTRDDPRAMQAALEALEVDVVLFWPLWRETFSFAVYEAVAAGCAVVTGPDGGNVAAVVAEADRGWVLPDEDALDAAFASGEIAALARARRKPMLYDLELSGMTVDLLRARAEA